MFDLHLPETPGRSATFDAVRTFLTDRGFRVVAEDLERPWGGFFVIDEAQCTRFAASFFPKAHVEALPEGSKLSPKFLLVAPGKRLSWQHHARRSELWRVIAGEVGVAVSRTDEQPAAARLTEGEVAQIEAGRRHRLIGLEAWGVVAEIWKHTDPERPSDEEDIVRVKDDFGR